MKKIYSLLVGALFLFASCDDDDETIQVIYFPDIISDIIEDALDNNTVGFEFMVEQSSLLVNESLTDPKSDFTYAEEINRSWINGWSKYSFDYTGETKDGGIEFLANAEGEYETYWMKSDDKSDNNWMLGDIAAESEFYTLSGQTIRDGYQYTKVYNDKFKSDMVMEFDNIVVDRIKGTIKEGVVRFTFEGVSSWDEIYTNSGQIRYSDYINEVIYD